MQTARLCKIVLQNERQYQAQQSGGLWRELDELFNGLYSSEEIAIPQSGPYNTCQMEEVPANSGEAV